MRFPCNAFVTAILVKYLLIRQEDKMNSQNMQLSLKKEKRIIKTKKPLAEYKTVNKINF